MVATKLYRFAALTLLILGLSACSAGSLLVNKPSNPRVNEAVTDLWERDLKRVAKNGDWILTRSYSLIGDVITTATFGESLSHASIYDAERGTIIEAIHPVVREVPLRSLLKRNRFVVIVRPTGLSDEDSDRSIVRAREALGAPFDYAGIFGLEQSGRFYCTELVVWASGLKSKSVLITPSSLLGYGETVYFSGTRDDRVVQNAALASDVLIAKRRAGSTAASLRVASTD